MILERVRPCADCKRMTRPSKTKLRDFPNTIVRGNVDRCLTCYLKVRGRPESKPRTPKPIRITTSSNVVLATVPGEQFPQRADCRPSCCRNPYICRTGYACACHGKES